jgi:hypothetical protein
MAGPASFPGPASVPHFHQITDFPTDSLQNRAVNLHRKLISFKITQAGRASALGWGSRRPLSDWAGDIAARRAAGEAHVVGVIRAQQIKVRLEGVSHRLSTRRGLLTLWFLDFTFRYTQQTIKMELPRSITVHSQIRLSGYGLASSK